MKFLLLLFLVPSISFSEKVSLSPEQAVEYLTIIYEDEIDKLNNLKEKFLLTNYDRVDINGSYFSSTGNIWHTSGAEDFTELMYELGVWQISRSKNSISFFKYSGKFQQIQSEIAISFPLKNFQNIDPLKNIQTCYAEIYYLAKTSDHCIVDIGDGWYLYHFWINHEYMPKSPTKKIFKADSILKIIKN